MSDKGNGPAEVGAGRPHSSTLKSSQVPQRGHLEATDVQVSYEGLRALNRVNLEVLEGSITGLIGPNGSGKTTFLNVVSGAQKMEHGTICLDGEQIDQLPAYRRARAGVARTFQTLRLFETLSVIDNVMLGATRLFRSGMLGSVLRTPRSRREWHERREKAREILAVFGDRLLPRIEHQVATLSYANRRRVEISRALMLEPRLLLLDEPTAGMNPHETWELADQVPQLMAMFSCSVLLVEHKMDVITHLCKQVYVLDHGECLAEGDPRSVQNNPAVAEAFLGVE